MFKKHAAFTQLFTWRKKKDYFNMGLQNVQLHSHHGLNLLGVSEKVLEPISQHIPLYLKRR